MQLDRLVVDEGWLELAFEDGTFAADVESPSKSPAESIEVAKEIARRCNAYDALLAAAKLGLAEAEGWIKDQLDGTGSYERALANLEPIRAAIAQSEGQP